MSSRTAVLIVIALGCAAAAALYVLRSTPFVLHLTQSAWERVQARRYDFSIEREVRIPMRDGVRLAANVYRPEKRDAGLATILIRLPYDKNRYPEARGAALVFARNGYAVVVQDLRGKFGSEGEFQPWRHAAEDGADTLDWIVAQPWSNGRVGTFGCSALGETQLILATAAHPHHTAAIALGAGGAIGSAGGRYGYFGVFEGGVFQLASGYGWFLGHGHKHGGAESVPAVDRRARLHELPIEGLIARDLGAAPNDYAQFLRHPPGDPWWSQLGYVAQDDRLPTPTLHVNNWFDQTVADTFELARIGNRESPLREGAGPRHRVIIAPGEHCGEAAVAASGRVGELPVANASQPWWDWYLAYFDAALRGGETPALPPYLFYVIGEDRWLASSSWPPATMTPQRWRLARGPRGANSREGDGRLLAPAVPMPRNAGTSFDEYRYDPMDPVPSRGGPVCCTGTPDARPGPADQRDVETRRDVLVYTSAPLAAPLRIAGPLRASLLVSSSAIDTDFVVRLVDVAPDGRALNVQEGALRARWRQGFERPVMLVPGERVRIEVDVRAIAWYFRAGHRLRLQVTSSSFPRLERNLNTGGRNYDESRGVVALNRVHHDAPDGSWIELPVVARLGEGLAVFGAREGDDASP